MLHLCYSNRCEELAAALCRELAADRARSGDMLATAHVVVPNQLVATKLKLHVAESSGIAANIALPFLDSFLAEQAPARLGVIDRARLQVLIDGVLDHAPLLECPALAPVREYLFAAGHDEDAVALRRFQLADRLAALFIDYSVTRPGLIASWERDRPFSGAQSPSDQLVEGWQRALFRAVRDRLDRAESRDGKRWLLLPSLFEEARPGELSLPPDVHIFGFSYLAPAYLRILRRLSETSRVRLYIFNPCGEFWEDIGDDLDDNLPLQLWARPGRDSVRALGELTGHDFVGRFAEPKGSSLLARIQGDVLARRPARPDTAVDDGSVRILACPNRRRELEIIGNEIWRRMRADPTLRFNEIAVYLTRRDQAAYQALVPSVFGELHGIPHHVARAPLGGPIVEALDLLLALPFGRFSRPELLRLLTHPTVIARYHDVDASDWIHWSDRLGIVHGADHQDHANTYIERDVFNWDQGIRRLALGAFMAGARSGEARAIRVSSAHYVPEELDRDALPAAARFALLARSLIEDARFCRAARMPLARWRVFLDLLATSYLVPRGEEQERQLSRCRHAIASLVDADLEDREVGYRTARELVRARLAAARQSSGEPLSAGVMVAPLAPMQSVPFRVVFVAGLGAGTSPAVTRESPLDLRASAPRPGDITARDRDRYTFLEALLSARDAFFTSYVAADSQTGERREPSSVVCELRQLLSGYGNHDVERTHPRRAWDPRYFPELYGAGDDELAGASLSLAARRRARASALRADLEAHLRRHRVGPPAAEFLRDHLIERSRTSPEADALLAQLGVPRIDRIPAGSGDPDAAISISLAMVRRFLETPLQAWASVVLRLREEELEDLVSREDESFSSSPLVTTMLLRGVFSAHLAAGGDREALMRRYRDAANLAELSGGAPTGVFSALDGERHRRVLRSWLEHIEALGGADRRWAAIGFGRATSLEIETELVPPLSLTVSLPGGPVEVELFGTTDPMDHPIAQGGLGSLVMIAGNRVRRGHVLRGFIDHLAMAAAGIDAGVHHVTIITGEERRERYRFDAWSTQGARSYLTDLVADLLGGPHDYLLPCEAVLEHLDNPDRALAERVAALARSPRRTMSSRFGPVSRLDGLAAPADAEAIAERRFGPLRDRMEKVP